MKERTVLAAMILATVTVAAQAGEMVMYENRDFNGRELVVRADMPDINTAGFNNHNASVLVRSGTWEVCAEANFRGFCAKLQPNKYGHLDTRFNERISSAREIGGPVADAGPATRKPAGSIRIFSGAGYRGRSMALDDDMPDFYAARFNDRARSLVVRKGTWELCSDDQYRGTCQVFQPGRYTDLGPLAGDISSARILRSRDRRFDERISSSRETGGPVADAGPAMRKPAGSIKIFSRAGYRGRRIALDDDMPDFSAAQFNDRASSLIVLKGTWELCSDDQYRGTCQVFQPGSYTDLGPLTGDISSARILRSRDRRFN